MRRPGRRGFTLVELVVVVLIIGILAASAIPQYNRVVERGRIAEAFSEFTAIKSGMNRYLLKNNTYASASSDLDMTPPTMKYFGTLTLTGTAANFTATLTRTGATQATYGAYTLSYVGPAGAMTCSNSPCSSDLLP